MSSLEPPVPASAVEPFVEPSDRRASIASVRQPAHRLGRWRRPAGLLLLGVVIFLWTATNFLASSILADNSFSKPYFVTYFNTSFFIIPLIPTLISKACQNPEELSREWHEWKAWVRGRYVPLKHEDGNEAIYVDSPHGHARRQSMSASQELLLGDPIDSSQIPSNKSHSFKKESGNKFTLVETAKLSLHFCIIWFVANYFVNACLEYTTVASSTILTSTSSVFTLVFGAIFGVEKFTLRKLIGVLASLAGIILISSVDLSGNTADDEHRGDFPEKSPREIAIGDALAFLSAVAYGIYAVFIKKRVPDESSVSMPLFFGLVGLINVVVLWPGFFLLHWTGIETFELPSSGRVTLILVCNAIGSLGADLAWAYAVLFTSPIVVTVGLSMTIPLSLIGQIILNSQTADLVYWIGAFVVVLSFLFVNNEEKRDSVMLMDERGILGDEQATTDDGRS